MSNRGRFYFVRHAGGEIRFRNILRKKGDELEPIIQIEAKVHSKWAPIIRCDRSHDFLHLDLFYKNGIKKKVALRSRNPCNAIIEVIEKLKRDWKKLFAELQYRDILKKFSRNEDFFKRELESAKKFLLKEAEHPELILNMRGKGVVGFSVDAILEKKEQLNASNSQSREDAK